MAATKRIIEQNVVIWTWDPLTLAEPIGVDLGPNFMAYVDRSVQFEGDFDGASVVMEGSNDGANFHTLTNPQGSSVSYGGPGLAQLTEFAAHMRPRVIGGTGATSIIVTVSARKDN